METPKINVYVLESAGRLASLIGQHFSDLVTLFPFSKRASLLEAFHFNRSHSTEIVVLDVGLTDTDIDLISKIKHRAANTEIMVLTESQDHHSVLRTLRQEVTQVWEKPLNEPAFIQLFSNHLHRIAVVGSQNFANYEARQNSSDSMYFNLKALFHSLVDELAESSPNTMAGDIAEIRHQFKARYESIQHTVLTIDDEDDIRSGIRLNLRKHYHVLDAENGTVALELLAKHPEIDVVFLDVRMPGEWGNVLLPKIKALRPDVDVIMLTAYEETAIAIETFQNGTYEYLNKPFTKAQLLECVHRTLNVKLTRQHSGNLPIDDRLVILEEFYAIKCVLGQPILYDEVGWFFREILVAGFDPQAPVPIRNGDIRQTITEILKTIDAETTVPLETSRDEAIRKTLAYTKNPTDENRASMQDALNRLGNLI